MALFTSKAKKKEAGAHVAPSEHVVADSHVTESHVVGGHVAAGHVADSLATPGAPESGVNALGFDNVSLQKKAKDHLWMHFSRQSVMEQNGVPIIVKGEGHHIFDSNGKKYIDGLSGLFVVNAGHGRKRLAAAAAKQAEELAFFPIWSYAHPAAIELADRLADLAPGELNRAFFSTGGGEAVGTAFKLAKQDWKP